MITTNRIYSWSSTKQTFHNGQQSHDCYRKNSKWRLQLHHWESLVLYLIGITKVKKKTEVYSFFMLGVNRWNLVGLVINIYIKL